MIRVAKGTIPDALAEGAVETAANQAAYGLDEAAYRDGRKKHTIRRAIYAHESVLAQLSADQHGKCCYCEVEVEVPYMERDVEHWRPKGAVKNLNGSPRLHPGYYWLAYDWENLFLACNVCNRLKKREQFPLAAGSARARSHEDDLSLERPLVLRPNGAEDPEDHIEYVSDQPRGLTEEGRMTIAIAGLDRLQDIKRNRHLVALRRAYGRLIRHLHETTPTAMQTVQEARAELELAVRPDQPFSVLSKGFLRDNPLPPP